jgi:putative membrane protein
MTRYQQFLIIAFSAIWILAAINPPDRQGWLMENILVFIFVPIIFIVGRYFKFSDVSYTLVMLFLVLHVIGSHWTYGQVPFGYTLGHWLHTDRNMYDRLVHFSFGFLLAHPIREVFLRLTNARGLWAYIFPLDIVLSFSAAYEIFEWLTAMIIDPATAAAFIGSQGDFWDTQKDMGSAAVGALLAIVLLFVLNWIFNPAFWTELKESIKIRNGKHFGEDHWKEFL